MINKQADHNEVHDDRGGDIAIAQPNSGQTLFTTMIFGDSLQDNAPPEISVDQKIPLLPTRIHGVAPALGIKQRKDFPKQSVAISSRIAPINQPVAGPFKPGLSRQLLMPGNDRAGSAFEM